MNSICKIFFSPEYAHHMVISSPLCLLTLQPQLWLSESLYTYRVWVNSGNWWWTGRPGVVQFMGSQRIGHDWATELNWTESIQIQYAKHTILVDLIVSGSQWLKLHIVTCLWLSVYRHCIYSKEHKTEKQATLRSVCTKSKIDIKPYASWFNILAQSFL